MLTKEYLNEWITRRAASLAARTVDSYRDEIERHFIPAFGEIELSALSSAKIAEMLAGIIQTGHTRSAENAYTVLHKALGDAVRDKFLSVSPMASVERPQHHAHGFQWLQSDEIGAYLDAVLTDRLRIAWLLALCCGLRRGELIGLRWEDIDLQHRTVRICNQRQRLRNGTIVDIPPKSESGFREIPLPDDLVSLLLFEWHSAGYVIVNQHGKPFTPSGLDQAHKKLIRRHRLPNITPHGLRTTCGAQAVITGVHVRVLQTILGHASYTTTARFYAAVDISAKVSAIDKISKNLVKYQGKTMPRLPDS